MINLSKYLLKLLIILTGRYYNCIWNLISVIGMCDSLPKIKICWNIKENINNRCQLMNTKKEAVGDVIPKIYSIKYFILILDYHEILN